MAITCSALGSKLSYFIIGGVGGRLMLFDVTSKSLLAENQAVHTGEIVNLFFYDA